jgi:hypothetical protein
MKAVHSYGLCCFFFFFLITRQLKLLNFPGIGTPLNSKGLSLENQAIAVMEAALRALVCLTGKLCQKCSCVGFFLEVDFLNEICMIVVVIYDGQTVVS